MTKGQRIREKRKEQGRSIEWLAGMVGIAEHSLSRYENDKAKDIPSEVVEKIAIALNCTPTYLMGWDNWELTTHRLL